MSDIIGWLSWLGLGGVAGVLALAYFVPALLPTVAVGVLKGLAESLAAVLQWLGQNLLAGAQHIFASRAAVFTLVFAVLLAGYSGDRWEWVRPYIPETFRSEPGQVKAARAQEAAKYRPAPKQATQKKPAASAWDEFRCGLLGNCT
jgi:hypothetical protein